MYIKKYKKKWNIPNGKGRKIFLVAFLQIPHEGSSAMYWGDLQVCGKIRKLKLVCHHWSLVQTWALLSPKQCVKNRKMRTLTLKAEMPHAIWSANYHKKHSCSHLSTRLGAWLWKTDWHLPQVAAQTHCSCLVMKAAAFPSVWLICNKPVSPDMSQPQWLCHGIFMTKMLLSESWGISRVCFTHRCMFFLVIRLLPKGLTNLAWAVSKAWPHVYNGHQIILLTSYQCPRIQERMNLLMRCCAHPWGRCE